MGRIWNIVELLHRVAKVKFDNTQSALYRAWCMQVFSMFKFLRERERECVCVCVCVNPSTFHMLSMCSTTELYPSSGFYYVYFISTKATTTQWYKNRNFSALKRAF
jgi:hypothetical protein